jgi:hypothetical protein
VVVEGSAGPLWCAGSTDSELTSGNQLRPGWSLESPTWLSRLVMQDDGNLVLYSIGGHVIWQSGTQTFAGASAIMEGNGNLVIQTARDKTVWSSETSSHAGAPPRRHRSGPDRCRITNGRCALVVLASGLMIRTRLRAPVGSRFSPTDRGQKRA